MDEVKVTVICTTYNHVRFIECALKSFVMQKTDFNFEVLVFDDASTDGTTDIVQRYAAMYPDKIIPIIAEENYYRRKKKKTPEYQKRTRGKYIALCEGDDYWTDPYKLQKQFDYMESHLDCTLCIHNAHIVDVNNKTIAESKVVHKSREVHTDEVIIGGGSFCMTNSIFCRVTDFYTSPPYFEILSLDYVRQIQLASIGCTYCFSDKMSAYRRGTPGSWTSRMKGNSLEQQQSRNMIHDKLNAMLDCFNEYTECRYSEAVACAKLKNEIEILMANNQYWKIFSPKYKKVLKTYTLKQRRNMLIKSVLYRRGKE